MGWIGGPSKDLGGKEASNQIAGFASTSAGRTESMASGAALRSANKEGAGGGGNGSDEGSGNKGNVGEEKTTKPDASK